jgi:hypothetical protein
MQIKTVASRVGTAHKMTTNRTMASENYRSDPTAENLTAKAWNFPVCRKS